MNTTDLLANVRIASPCSARWADMSGDDRTRYCAHCQKHVYNLSSMTAEAASELVRAREGNLCGRFYQRPDGTLLTTDCPVGAGQVLRRMTQLAAAAVALLFASIAVSAWACEPNQRRARDARPKVYQAWDDALVAAKNWVKPKSAPVPPRGPALLGDICITPSAIKVAPKTPSPDKS